MCPVSLSFLVSLFLFTFLVLPAADAIDLDVDDEGSFFHRD